MSKLALAQLLLVTGVAIVLAIATRATFRRLALPEQVGYLLLGLGLRIAVTASSTPSGIRGPATPPLGDGQESKEGRCSPS